MFQAAPTILTGLDREFVSSTRDAYERQVSPEVAQAFDALLEADSALSAVVKTATHVSQDSQNASFIAEIERAAAAAKDAGRAFDAAITEGA